MDGLVSHAAQRRSCSHIFEKILAILLSAALAMSLAPSLSWADELADASLSAYEQQGNTESADVDASADDSLKESGEDDSSKVSASSQKATLSVDEATSDFLAQASTTTDDSSISETIEVSISIIGQDSAGNTQIWANETDFTLAEGATAADLSEVLFEFLGLNASYGMSTWGWSLDSITSPFDSSLTLDMSVDSSGNWLYWQLFVNGVSSDSMADGVVLKSGDSIVWYYSAYGNSLPDSDDFVIDAGVERPDYDAAWSTFAGTSSGAVTTASTPTESADLAWLFEYAGEGSADLLLVNGDVYVVSGSVLSKIDGNTGELLARTSTGLSAAYFCRIAYADGLILIPGDDGSIAAFTADTLTCTWKTAALDSDESYQALSSLTVNGCYVYAGFTVVSGASQTGTEGTLVCVSVDDGSLVWSKTYKSSETDSAEGYYWAGAAVSGEDIVIGNEAGKVALINGATGEELSSVSIGTPCRAGIVVDPDDENVFYAVSRNDGKLYRIVREGGMLSLSGSVSFAAQSTSTPAIVEGMAFVCGVNDSGTGTLSVIDLESMTVLYQVEGGSGAAQSSPLVSVQGDDIYVYFTCNARPGGVYAYHLGDSQAYQLYVPDSDYQQYSTSSVIADEEGNLYFTNDSGTLFKLQPAASVSGGSQGSSSAESGESSSQASSSASEGASSSSSSGDEANLSLGEGNTDISSRFVQTVADNSEGGFAQDDTAEESNEESGDSSENASSTSAYASTPSDSSADNLNQDVSDNAAADSSQFPIASILGLIVGLACLIAAIIWLVLLHRRSSVGGGRA